MFIGKNPWQSQSFPRARVVLKEISKDPERTLIVIDPVRTETAELADEEEAAAVAAFRAQQVAGPIVTVPQAEVRRRFGLAKQ